MCAVLGKSNYAVIFVNNRLCDQEATVTLSVAQTGYGGKLCPTRTVATGIIIGIVVASVLVAFCLIYCLVRCLCCR